MWSITGVLVIGVIMMLIEGPSLIKKKQKKDLWVFSILLLLGVVLNILEMREVTILNPLEVITPIFQPVSDVITNLFK